MSVVPDTDKNTYIGPYIGNLDSWGNRHAVSCVAMWGLA